LQCGVVASTWHVALTSVAAATGFLRKVYGIVCAQLFLTVVVAALIRTSAVITSFVQSRWGCSLRAGVVWWCVVVMGLEGVACLGWNYCVCSFLPSRVVSDSVAHHSPILTHTSFPVLTHLSPWMLYLSFALAMGSLFALMAKRKEHPVNMYLLAVFVSVVCVPAVFVSVVCVPTVFVSGVCVLAVLAD